MMDVFLSKTIPCFVMCLCYWTCNVNCQESTTAPTGTNGSITIGIISNGTYGKTVDTYKQFGYGITLISLTVQTSEVYQIFRSVREFDEDPSVDVIMLFDYDPSILYMSDVIKSKNKELIKWGERTRNSASLSTRQKRHISDHDICGDEPDKLQYSDNCLTESDLNTTTSDSMMITLLGPQAINTLVKELRWKLVIILHETTTEKETADLVDLLSAQGVLFSMFNVDHVPDLHDVLARIYTSMVPKMQDINIVVVCEFHCARKVFRTANMFDDQRLRNGAQTLLKKFSRWLVVVYGRSIGVSYALKNCASHLDNVAIIAIPEISGASTKDSSAILENIIQDIHRAESIDHEDKKFKEEVIHRLQQEAANWTPPGTPKCLGYYIETLLWTKRHGHRIRDFTSVGYIELNGKVIVDSDIFPNIKYGYNGFEFRASTLPYDPFVKKEIVNNTAVYSGMCIDILDELAHKLNFTYKLSEPEDQMWGSFEVVDNQTVFNGLIGQLQREEVDIVVAPISIQSEREMVVDFTYPFYYEYTTIIVKKPNINATKWRTLVDPFKWEVLVSIVIALFLVTIMGFLMEKYNPYYQIPEHAQERYMTGGIHTWHSSFWYMYGALLCQGGVHLPDSVSGRTLVSFWWLFCIIIVGTYCGNLIAFLTVTKERPPFENMEEMIELKGEYKWGIMGGTAWEDIFATSSRHEFKATNEGIQEFRKSDPDVMNTNMNVHIEKVIQGNYAWIGDLTSIEKYIGENCDLLKTKDEFMPLKYAIGFPNNSPHVQTFSKELMTYNEMGLFQIWKRKNWPKASFCAGKMTTEAKPINLIDVQSAFYVCVIGVFLGTMTFLSEIILSKFKRCDPRSQSSNKEGPVTIFNSVSSSQRAGSTTTEETSFNCDINVSRSSLATQL